MDNNIYIGSTKLPPLPADGFALSREPIWSANAGRTADCTFVGDVKAWKWNGSLNWGRLTFAEVAVIRAAVTTLTKPFFNLTFTDDTGTRRTITCYSTSPKSTIRIYKDSSGEVSALSVDIVEV